MQTRRLKEYIAGTIILLIDLLTLLICYFAHQLIILKAKIVPASANIIYCFYWPFFVLIYHTFINQEPEHDCKDSAYMLSII